MNLKGEQLYASWNSIFTDQVWPSGLSIYDFGSSPATPFGSAFTGNVWTGTGLNGLWQTTSDGNNCKSWTSTGFWFGILDPYWAKVGDFATGQRKVLNASEERCDANLRLTCVLVPPEPPITIENYDGSAIGPISGKGHGDAIAYLGVPYAAKPIGNRRFTPPGKVDPWTTTRAMTSHALMCPQPPLLPNPIPNPLITYAGSEDCLYLRASTAGSMRHIRWKSASSAIFAGLASFRIR